MNLARLTLALTVFLLAGTAQAQCVQDRHGATLCPQADSRCLRDLHGDWWCSPSGGGVALDRGRVPVCGPGSCVTDLRGDVRCAPEPRGSAALDRYREAQCTGQCVPASQAACSKLQ